MKNKKYLSNEIAVMTNMEEIVGSYEEIAAMRMRKVKKSVLLNREFLGGLNNIYQRVWYTYQSHLQNKNPFGHKKANVSLHTNERTVSILMSSNTRLYGDIIKRTFDLFLENVRNFDTDIIVMGKVGRQMLQENAPELKYTYYEISDIGVDREYLKGIVDKIIEYKNVVAYHGLYISVLNQSPIRTYVTGQVANIRESTNKDALKCLIEPSVEEVAYFFEKQILSAIFEQTMFESVLGKFASRMISLDVASENIRKSMTNLRFQLLKVRHNINNSKQLERLSGLALLD